MEIVNIKDFSERVHSQLFDHILPFWSGPTLDREQGGWVAWMANDGRVDHSQPQGLIVNSRILWTFAAVHRAAPSVNSNEMAARAYAVMNNRFWDAQHGGAFWRLDRIGHMLDDSKKIYGQAFFIYALSEYKLAFGSPEALARAIELFELIEQHAHDPQHGGYWEVCNRDWSIAADSRLSEKDMNEKKSMNTHLHVLEAYTNLYRAWRDPRVEQRLRELIAIFQTRIIESSRHHFIHFFNDQWESRSQSYTFGHDIEGSWLLCEAAEVLGDDALRLSVSVVAVQLADAVLKESLDNDGGLFYEGRDGTIIDVGKEWWPQAEAVVGLLNAFQITGDAKYFSAARGVWDYIEERIVDRVHGDWFWRITPEGVPDATLPKVSEWKGPYHSGRACLETLRRLREISAAHDGLTALAGHH